MKIIISLGRAIDLGLPSGRIWSDRNFLSDDVDDSGMVLSLDAAKNTLRMLRESLTTPRAAVESGICDTVRLITGNWRTPSVDDYYELADCCGWSLENGHFIVTGPSGKSLRFPYYQPMLTVNPEDGIDSEIETVFDLGNDQTTSDYPPSVPVNMATCEMAYGANFIRPVCDRGDIQLTQLIIGVNDAINVTAYLSEPIDNAPALVWEDDDSFIAYYFEGQIFCNNPGTTCIRVRCPELGLESKIEVTAVEESVLL